MSAKTLSKLAVPGATLHYEVTGSGPLLLLIADGESDSGAFDSIVGPLAAEYTVVAYDPRGNSRSPYAGLAVGEEPVDEQVEVSSADALALMDLLSPDHPAFVFGTGTGAITGMDLMSRYPDRVRMLVAHEPPAVELLAEAANSREFFAEVYDTCRREGVPMAQLLYAGGTGLDEDDLPAPEDLRPEFRELLDRTEANAGNFFAHKMLPFTRYRPDLRALKEVADKVVPAAGVAAARHLPAQPVMVLSDAIGWPVVSFPGGHNGYASHPIQFATLLAQVLEAELS
ncbi:alpha/beta hydrolase [Kribbella qitaiheensis]|uniref:Alpha/beta hydrolase n=1 Tax=Kribbella qitaiheensis TaxID=1544730 RepID=A0A7G6WWM4_9ACTN|nr:alpha/beta hydrolase [Kribbella qitaiheensis]QNE18389.1 alpha/beta hydrolase [Kribbella qitaiheensis]